MKKLSILLTALSLTGCSSLSSMSKLLPKSYDPMLGSMYIGVKLDIDGLSCKDSTPDQWKIAQFDAKRLAAYSSFRKDPQADNALSVEKNLASAADKPTICDNYLKIVKVRLEILNKAWGKR